MKKVLVILGMHRSGTSVTANWLFSCGVNLGQSFHKASKFNLKGYYEDIEFLQLHKKLLSEENIHPSGHEDFKKLNLSNNQIQEIKDLLSKKNSSHQWGWKEPRTCLFIDYYMDLISSGVFLVVYRRCEDVISSLIKRQVTFENSNSKNLIKKLKSKWSNKRKKKEAIKRYCNIWIYYNKKLLETFENIDNEAILYTSVNHLKEYNEDIFNKLKELGFKINYIDFNRIYESNLMNESSISYSDLPSDMKSKVKDIDMRFQELIYRKN